MRIPEGRQMCREKCVRKIFITIVVTLSVELCMPCVHSAISLHVTKNQAGQVFVTWSPGASPYRLFQSNSVPIGGSEVVNIGNPPQPYEITIPVNYNTNPVAFFRIADNSSGPTANVNNPPNGSPTTSRSVTASGSTSGGAVYSVWVNKTPAKVQGMTFDTAPLGMLVPLVLGQNTLYTTTLSTDENVSVTTTTVTRNPGNAPTQITFSPAGQTQQYTTATFVVTMNDSGQFNIGTFKGYIDGVLAPTSGPQAFVLSPENGLTTSGTATWQGMLPPGEHILQAVVTDASNNIGSSSVAYRFLGPVLSSISPPASLPNTTVTIFGNGFGTTANTTVLFTGPTGALPATITSITSTQIQVIVPQNTVDGPVKVTVGTVASNQLPFDIAFTTAGAVARELAIDNQDRVYYIPSSRNSVIRLNQNGSGATTIFVSPTEEVTGIAFDRPDRTTLYVITRGDPTSQGPHFTHKTGRIYSVNISSGVSTLRVVLPLSTYSDPGGIDVKLPYAYVGVDRSNEVAEVVLQVNLGSGVTTESVSLPFSQCIYGDVKVDDNNNIYSILYDGSVQGCPSGWDWQLYRGTTWVSFSANEMNVDCLNTVRYTDPFDGYVCRLVGSSLYCDLPVSSSASGIDIDSKGNLFVGVSSGVQRLTGTGAKVTSCANDFRVSFASLFPPDPPVPTRIYADFDPTCCDMPDVQFTQLKVCLSDSSLPLGPSDRVTWSWQDVDDPSSDSTIDPNGNAGGDNYGWLDGLTPFTEEPGYTLSIQGGQYTTAYDSSRCSMVRFHPTDAPGDNFTVTALANTKLGANSVTSDVMTVWKTLQVELDSMGVVTGPLDFNDDDALVGDIPPRTGALLRDAFAQAYINVSLNPLHNNGDVSFKTHIPTSDLLSDNEQDSQIRTQGLDLDTDGTPHGRTSESDPGSWWVYISDGYESYVEEDWDPNGEAPPVPPGAPPGATFGITWGPPGSAGKWGFVFPEVTRDYCGSYGADDAYCAELAVLHEIGHECGLIHPVPPHTFPVEVMDHPYSPEPWHDNPPPPQFFVPPPTFTAREIRLLRCRCPCPSGQTQCPCPTGQNHCLAPGSDPAQ